MKVVILAGGLGTRLSEETDLRPKPMVEVGGRPLLWHIMKGYSSFGFNEFIICLGYKGYHIKEYFSNYYLHQSDVTFDLRNNATQIHSNSSEPWKVTLVDTGLDTMTGGRIKRVQPYIGNEPFLMTYGDGVSDLDIHSLVDFHKRKGKYATVTAVQPAGRFGAMTIDKSDSVTSFTEKPVGDGAWINAGFFVLEPAIFDYINEGDATYWERDPLRRLAKDGQLVTYKHHGFWKCMDTLRDKTELETLWRNGEARWKSWK
ncbi:MAG TPA: glucose-1-phosphate cytidylyltransferase [Nitrospiria bacterium]